MKKLLFFLVFAALTLTTRAQTEDEIKKDFTGPVFEFEHEVINYGDIDKNSDGKRVFKFKNVGKAPLIIYSVKGSCGCTVPTKPEEPVLPGETGEIKVKYATNRVGPFSKTVTVKSNAFKPTVILHVKGRVLDQEAANVLEKKKSTIQQN